MRRAPRRRRAARQSLQRTFIYRRGTEMRARLLIFACAAAAHAVAGAAASSWNLTGFWTLTTGAAEGYTSAPAGPGLSAYALACVQGPCTGWRKGNLTVRDEASGAVWVAFDSGVAHGGVVSGAPGALRVAWADASAWAQAPAELDIHLFPHSHTDPGWL